MKLSPRDAPRYLARPDPKRPGLLLFGADSMRVALRRQEVIKALIGPQGEAEMRLTRMQGAELRRDGALLLDAVKAQGFFPGPRVVFVEEATDDSTAEAARAALAEWCEGDAQIIITAGQLKPASKLRKLFEGHPSAYALGIYDDPPGRDEIEAMLRQNGLSGLGRDAMNEITALAKTVDPGELQQVLGKLGLYKYGDDSPVTSEDIAACMPATVEAGTETLFNTVAEARSADLGPILRRIEGQGIAPVTLCIGALRHFRLLHAARVDGSGSRALVSVRNFKQRDRMIKQAQRWDRRRLERAIEQLVDTDLALRSASNAPAMAVLERTLIRLALLTSKDR